MKEFEALYCPKCGCGDISIESNIDLRYSKIQCTECEYAVAKKVDEDTLVEKWNKLLRKPLQWLKDNSDNLYKFNHITYRFQCGDEFKIADVTVEGTPQEAAQYVLNSYKTGTCEIINNQRCK